MQVVRVWLVGRNEYNSLVFDYPGCSNAIAREKLTFNIAMRVFGIDSTKNSANGRFRLLERI